MCFNVVKKTTVKSSVYRILRIIMIRLFAFTRMSAMTNPKTLNNPDKATIKRAEDAYKRALFSKWLEEKVHDWAEDEDSDASLALICPFNK